MYNKIFNVFAVVLFCVSLLTAGASFADNSVADGIVNIVLAALWGSILFMEWLALLNRTKIGDRMEMLMKRAIRDLNEFIANDMANRKADYAKHSSKTTKAKSTKSVTSRSKNAGTRITRNRATKVSTAKKTV